MNMKFVKVDAGNVVGGADERLRVSIQDLLIWAIRDECCMDWLDSEANKIGGVRSQLVMMVRHLRLGRSVDNSGVVCTRVAPDAMAVAFAVDSLARHEKRLIIEHAKNADMPYLPTGELVYINGDGDVVKRVAGKVYEREYRNVGGVRKQIRLNYCAVAPLFSDADIGHFIPLYNDWVGALKVLHEQLIDLTHHLILDGSVPNFRR